MRAGLALLLSFLPLLSFSVAAQDDRADGIWREALERAEREKKPVVILFRTNPCERCPEFERDSIAHPAIVRRLPNVVYAALPGGVGGAAKVWGSEKAGVGLFDHSGALRARWLVVPDTTNFGAILDSAVAVTPHFARALQLRASGAQRAADVEVATALGMLERIPEARAILAAALADHDRETRQAAIVAGAVLDMREGKRVKALAELERTVADAATPKIAGDAWMAIGAIRSSAGGVEEAFRAFTNAVEVLDPASPAYTAAQKALATLRQARAASGVIRVLPLAHQVVAGRQTVKTHVASASIARVAFSLDGREIARVTSPPFSASLDFGAVPERHSIGVVAFDRKGKAIGRHERIVNEAGDTFWLRLVSPREGPAGGAVRVTMNVRIPAARRIRRVELSWNDAQRAVITEGPWETSVQIPEGQVGVLRAVAELDDGRTAEDAVLLNAGGFADQTSVQLVELPITILSRNGSTPAITADRIVVHEGNKRRRVESVATAAETPLTVGLLIDASASMQKPLPDVQEAAIRFLETMLGERDRAFLVTFDSRARLVQPATSDVPLLRRQIMSIFPNDLTALHDAIVLGLLQFEGIKGRRALIVFTDGLDRTSEYRPEEVGELARRVNVPIHLIEAPALGVGQSELHRVARSTGGTAHTLVALAELPDVYARIEAALRAQILAFVRTDPATKENEWRNVRIEVEGKDLDVFAPEGYSVPW